MAKNLDVKKYILPFFKDKMKYANEKSSWYFSKVQRFQVLSLQDACFDFRTIAKLCNVFKWEILTLTLSYGKTSPGKQNILLLICWSTSPKKEWVSAKLCHIHGCKFWNNPELKSANNIKFRPKDFVLTMLASSKKNFHYHKFDTTYQK